MEVGHAISPSKKNLFVYAPRLEASYTESWDLTRSIQGNRTSRRSRHSEPRPRGLWNSGQSCHLGSAISALAAVPLLRDWLQQQVPTYESPFTLVKQYLLDAARSSGYQRPLDPRPVLSLLERSGWKSRHAQDAHETMARLLEILEDWFLANSGVRTRPFKLSADFIEDAAPQACQGRLPLVRTWKRPSWGSVPFSVVNSSLNWCHRCDYRSPVSFQPSFLLTLPVPGMEQTLAELLVRTHMAAEKVEMTCDSCMQFGQHTRSLQIKKFPEVLVLHLQKAIYLPGGVGASSRRVALSRRLDLPVCSVDGKILRVKSYELRSVVRHRGSASGRNSHFDAMVSQDCEGVRHGLLAVARADRWWHVDDEHVTKCDATAACNPAYAYLVIYDRRRSVPAREFKLAAFR